ncbi:PepSY domain-containing protein [Capnocytophaga canimorsus]|uniref:PepSY domain-containing protein n=1 Tax=Capnocytophaga canimorsus TaxID=28188 RepID=UPI0037D043A0
MIFSLWRYAHLALALVASVFIFIASATGIILAIEPIENQLKPLKSARFENTLLSQTLQAVKNKYPETVRLEVEHSGFVLIETINEQGENETFYIHPKTAEKIGSSSPKKPLYQFATTLHRSLFMGSVGRVIMAITSLLLLLIALTGIWLIIKRQKHWWRFFHKVIKDGFYPYYHVILGRWTLIPIVIISFTGIYLSIEKFSWLPDASPKHHFNPPQENLSKAEQEMGAFDKPLSQVKQLEFPFSDDPEDYFTLQLTHKELLIHPLSGEIISEYDYPLTKMISYYSFILHTGQGNIFWAIILIFTCFGLLFFMYSGFAITLKRKNTAIKNLYKKEDCPYLILVGSESGSTLAFADLLHQSLLKQGKKSFLTTMNAYTPYPKMKHLVVMTSTYGQGDAPSNANKFEDIFEKHPPMADFSFAVVGFGSYAYPDFCKFAFETEILLRKLPNAQALLPIYTINNQSFEDFTQWVNLWAEKHQISLTIEANNLLRKKHKQQLFEVVQKSVINQDDTFLITLKIIGNKSFQSGDLLGITSDVDQRERLYSIGKISKKNILLSIKKHEKGLISNLLYTTNIGDILKARIIKNTSFHFPHRATKVMCIATGTGIAPFLGMMTHRPKAELYLFWGGKTQKSFEIYRPWISSKIFCGFAFSQNTPKQYVQDLISERRTLVAELLSQRGTIMICGSVAMQKEILEVLENICKNQLNKPLHHFQNRGQLRMDCY